MVVKMQMLEIPLKSVFEGMIPYLQTSLGDVNSLCYYVSVITTFVYNGLSGPFQEEVIIYLTLTAYLHAYLPPYSIRVFKGSDNILLILECT